MHLRKLSLTIIIVIIGAQVIFGKKSPSPKKYLRDAQYFYEYLNYGYALPYFEGYLQTDSSNLDVNYKAAQCYYYAAPDKSPAIPLYESAKFEYPDSYLRLAELYHLQTDFDNARLNLSVYREMYEPDSATLQFIDTLSVQIDRAEKAMDNPENAEIILLGDSINSVYPDYAPILTPDGQFMFFTSRREGSTGDFKDPNGQYFEDIYMSEYIDGHWSKAKNMGRPINSDTHDACLGITADMQTMFIYRTNDDGSGGNIYESHFTGKKWDKPQIIEADFNLERKNVKVISLTVAPDSVSYYYVSNQPGGYGGTDIYKVVRFGPNFWSKPQNLGPTINTPEDEDSPFIHYDGKTMYFSSKGHNSIGSFDVFKTQLQANGKWTKPENLGFPINTVRDDRCLVKMPDGQTTFFSTFNYETEHLHDIYMAYLPAREVSYALVRGLVQDKSADVIRCELRVVHAETKKMVGIYRPNLLTGKFVMLFPPSGKYLIEVLKKGEVLEEIEFDVPEGVSVLFDQLTIILHEN